VHDGPRFGRGTARRSSSAAQPDRALIREEDTNVQGDVGAPMAAGKSRMIFPDRGDPDHRRIATTWLSLALDGMRYPHLGGGRAGRLPPASYFSKSCHTARRSARCRRINGIPAADRPYGELSRRSLVGDRGCRGSGDVARPTVAQSRSRTRGTTMRSWLAGRFVLYVRAECAQEQPGGMRSFRDLQNGGRLGAPKRAEPLPVGPGEGRGNPLPRGPDCLFELRRLTRAGGAVGSRA